jgi:hypothetical protein
MYKVLVVLEPFKIIFILNLVSSVLPEKYLRFCVLFFAPAKTLIYAQCKD